MPSLIPFTEITHLFTEFEHTAWRLETRPGYASDRESPKWQRWKAGQDVANEPPDSWRTNVTEQTALGKRFERVRLVDDPPTEGQRFLLASGLGNVAAGEDIRQLTRAEAVRLDLPAFDFWLFDSRTLVKFVIDDAGTTLGVRVLEDAASVVRACQVRDIAWHHAVPTREFQTRVPSGT
ncbi:DUF6879 family protein [Streptomyces niveus]|uniref:DUF6879 family protein n=1 Tax=Streptomyces niveus TaxID=193462 RepID=UPI0035E300BF